MEYNHKMHRRRSMRLHGYDYSQQGVYFITICTYERKCIFGEIVNDAMVLNRFGVIARNEWIESSKIRLEIEMDECVVMPNHLHGIVVINDAGNHEPDERNRGLKCRSISSFVAGFKATVTTKINTIRGVSGAAVWQQNYYDHIIRNEKSLGKIREYVVNNPQTWQQDVLFYQ